MFAAERVGDEEAPSDHEAIARQMIEEIGRGGEIRHSHGSFWQWNGSCHEQLKDEKIYKIVAERVKGNKLAKRHNDYAAIVKTIAVLTEAPIGENELGVNFANGFLDMNGQLHDHSPTFGKTFTMPFNYVPARRHECHKWLGMLETAWGDDADFQEKVDALQEVMAATMFGMGPKYQRAILLYGKGGTGKSQVLDILRSMMPENAVCALPPHKWSERFALTSMVGKVLNVCGELPEEAMISGERFKGIVCGEPQDTEYKGKDGFTFSPVCTHWFASNHLPRSRDSSDGFVRRWIVFEFSRKIREEERILNFAEVVIAEEREAIAAWVIDGLKRLLSKREYTLPASHSRLENLVLRSNNSVAAFLQSSERVRPDDEFEADVQHIFDEYILYMKNVSRGYGTTFERFKVMLEQLGFHVDDYQDEMKVVRSKVRGLRMCVPKMERQNG
jgi:P4 family phage/plasmid primase-like protien